MGKNKIFDIEAVKAEVDQIVERIQVEDEKIKQAQGNQAQSYIAKGCLFVELQQKTKRKLKWSDVLKERGQCARVASRYLKIGKAWGAQKGLMSPFVLEKLPADLLKLEVLAQLKPEQLERFVIDHDCKELNRSEVSRRVKQVTGKTRTTPKRTPKLGEAIENFFDKVKEQLAEHPDDMKLRDEVWQALQTHVKEVEVMLAADEAAPEVDAVADIEPEAVADIEPEAVADIEPEAVAEMKV